MIKIYEGDERFLNFQTFSFHFFKFCRKIHILANILLMRMIEK
jgi:hypothetical protein